MSWFKRLFRKPPSNAGNPVSYDAAPADYRMQSPADDTMRALPGFNASANALVATTRLGGTGATDLRYRRAFSPSLPVSAGGRFAGRTAILTRIIGALEDQQLHIVLYGERGVGKTSTLRVVQEQASKADYLVQYFSCGAQTELEPFIRSVVEKIPALYLDTTDDIERDQERKATLADHLPKGALTVSQFTEALSHVVGTKILLILDEFDRAESPRFRGGIAELIKNLSDRSIPVQLVIAGVSSNLNALISQVPSIRRNILGVEMPNMDATEIAELVAKGEQQGGLPFDDAAVDRVVTTSAGLPYLAALLGQHATILAVEGGARCVTAGHIDQAIERAAEDIGGRLSPATKFAIGSATGSGDGHALFQAADLAVKNGGLIHDAEIIAQLNAAAPQVTRLFEVDTSDPRSPWRFAEDGASSYIWLNHRAR